ncbi:IS21 family transposase [Paenibacillus yanchengensis]|uniref:IS21 family transposase n=1 Tax=Paenibacillus yanchengensis TaxID=2035833 RepID=A0ABW4YPH6_9BACL
MGPYLDIIDTWLKEDLTKHKKQRHTQTRIYDRLVEECKYTGGKRTVTTYVSKKKKELAQPVDKYIDLQHPGGEAQVDFGTANVTHEQKIIQIKYVVMSFPDSNAAYIWFTPSENIDCFLTGLQELMQIVGGVPKKIWFDNLSAAVVKIESYYDRKMTEKFTAFALHYGFQYEFCGVGKGHEKGSVENKVGCTRRNWMVPMPTLTLWEDLNKQMKAKAEQYMQEIHYEKKQPIHILFEEEKAKLLSLPSEPFEVYRLEAAVLDKYGRVPFEGQKYPMAKGSLNEAVLLKIYWDEVEVLNQDYERLGTFSRPYSLKEQAIDWAAELTVIHKKPKAVTYAWIYSQLPLSLQNYVSIAEPNKRKLRIGWLVKWLRSGYSMDHISEAVDRTSVYQQDQEGVLYHALYQVSHPVASMEVLTEHYTPVDVKDYDPDLEAYDQLSKGVGVI